MSKFNVNTNHPLIPNANQYLNEQYYVSIHSQDRDIIKYPNSSEFEIELPQDYLNVQSLSLANWSFPSNYNVFSDLNANRKMVFQFLTIYDPGVGTGLTQQIHDILAANLDHLFVITIEEGYYTPESMASELQKKFNSAVNYFLIDKDPSLTDDLFVIDGNDKDNGYSAFKIIYNDVQQKLWFGNERDSFQLVNDALIFGSEEYLDTRCARRNVLPEYTNWGLPGYLGFTRCSEIAVAPEYSHQLVQADSNVAPYTPATGEPLIIVPRLYSSDFMFYREADGTPITEYDNAKPGMWLLPNKDLPGSKVFFLKTPMKINLMGPAYFYLELEGYNCIDETSPYNLSKFTATTNRTNGVVNASFAKISIPTTPVSQWYDDSSPSYKWFNPPAERIRKLKVKLRYHNGQMPEMGNFDYSFMLQFNMLRPQMERKSSVFSVNG